MPQSSVVYPWNNKPLLPIERGIPTHEEMRLAEIRRKEFLQAKKQVDDQLETVSSSIYWRFDQREKQKGFDSARRWLTESVVKVMLPRIARVNSGYRLNEIDDDDFRALFGDRATQSPQHNGVVAFLRLRTQRQRLPDLDSQALKSLANAAAHVAATEVARLTHAQGDKSEWRIVYDHYHHLARITRLLGVQPPLWRKLEKCFVPFDAQPAIRRMCDARWWLNSLRRTANRWREHLAIAMGYVHKHASPNVSTTALRDWHEQRRRTNEWRKCMELEDEEGNRISLMDGYAASQANPAIRRTELMVRLRGYEDIANAEGYVGAFVTITAPSSHHATLENGRVNRKWNGASPADTQRYLNGVWACARAKCHRQKLRFFGMRSAEPHHDGTPHSHLLIFARPEDLPRILEILRDYAMAADCDELRSAVAANARFDAEAIDPEKGSATGYVAKYISKNIDGYAMDGEIDDESGRPIKESAQRATAWASRWGIRQFQFIGCTPVTVWRELRRLNDSEAAHGLSVEFAACHDAANAPDWAGYVNAQGGPLVKRDDLAVRTWYQPAEVLNQYGEEMLSIRGLFDTVVGGDSPILTRLKQWKIVPKLAVDVSNADALPRSSANNCMGDPGPPTADWRTTPPLPLPDAALNTRVEKIYRHAAEKGLVLSPGDARSLAEGKVMKIDGQRYCALATGVLLARAPSAAEKAAALMQRVKRLCNKGVTA
ncbi:replication endonuclease [Sodalis endosymbiont of Spalangia cameroni]|uniref:replication endonuclease n=1 Tax=Sodalis praecaptivus TaxID=1239307 RepID=UPI0031FA316F